MKIDLKKLFPVVFWGSVWGLCEASLGYLLHIADFIPMSSSLILVPLAVYFLKTLYNKTGSAFSVFAASVVAAVIKCLDFLLPFLPAIKTLNPIFAILAEGLAALAFIKLLAEKNPLKTIGAAVGISLAWRLAFLIVNIPVYLITSAGILKFGAANAVEFVILEGLASAAVIFGVSYIPAPKKESYNIGIFPAVGAFIIAIGAEALFMNL